MSKKVGLVILDGWGIATDPKRSAIDAANTPFVDSLDAYPKATLVTYGEQVGLPAGQMGNSEVGHLNIGAGRIVYQDLAKINKAIREDTLASNETLQSLIQYAKADAKPVHLMGLLSDGGVHAHIDHLVALVDILTQANVEQVYIHAFLDGRDTDPHGGESYVAELESKLNGTTAKLVSVVGRYYAMDRDNRWERVQVAYDLLTQGVGLEVDSFGDYLRQSYADGITDEFVKPATSPDFRPIGEGDAVLFYNYRTDRPRQITKVLTQEPIEGTSMQPIANLHFVTMTRYDENFDGLHVMMEKDNLVDTLGEVVAKVGMTQIRIAETEKYPHVTFFFSGGREAEFEGERRILVNSPKVDTYDLQPEMSAYALTDKLCDALNADDRPNYFCLNYANTDMVGHTGVFEAAVKATEAVDDCLSRLVSTAMANGYELIIIADHGNSDIMINEDGSPHTAHTTNLVPIWYISDNKGASLKSGKLADVAPTILKLLGVEQPSLMTGKALVE